MTSFSITSSPTSSPGTPPTQPLGTPPSQEGPAQKKRCLSRTSKFYAAQTQEKYPTLETITEMVNTAKVACAKTKNNVSVLDEPEAIYAAKLEHPLDAAVHEVSDIGVGREDNQDRLLCLKSDQGILLGVFDGFGKDYGAEFAKKEFESSFFTLLDVHKCPKETIQRLFDSIQEKMKIQYLIDPVKKEAQKKYYYVGTTASVSYIDRNTGVHIHGALGDSEIKTFRSKSEKLTVIPNTNVVNWLTPCEYKRGLEAVLKDAEEMKKDLPAIWAEEVNEKKVKHYRVRGLNLPRGLGSMCSGEHLLQKGEFTTHLMQSGDVVVAGSDGLWDCMSKDAIADVVKNSSIEQVAGILVEKAKAVMQAKVDKAASEGRKAIGDNVSVIVAKISY